MEDVRSRLDRILAAQHGGAVEEGWPSTPFLAFSLWLAEADLSEVGPQLDRSDDDPDGAAGRYRGVTVYPLGDRPAGRGPWGEYRGVWFAYMPALYVD